MKNKNQSNQGDNKMSEVKKSEKNKDHAKVMFVRTNPITGVENEKTFYVNLDKLEQYDYGMIDAKEAFPHLSEENHEWIETGMCW